MSRTTRNRTTNRTIIRPLASPLAVAAALALLLSPLAGEAARAQRPTRAPDLAKIAAGDTIVVHYESNGCFHSRNFRFVFSKAKGGAELRVLRGPNRWGQPKGQKGWKQVRSRRLASAQLAQLDKLLNHARKKLPGGCTTTTSYTVELQRGGRTIASEKLVDGTCRAPHTKLSFFALSR